MKTHYSAHPQDDEERAACGTWLGEGSNLTGDWSCVDCRHCLRSKGKIASAVAAEEEAIVEQMGDMANFMRQQRASVLQEVAQ